MENISEVIVNSYGISNAFDRTESDALFEDEGTCSSDEFLGFAVSGLKMIKVFVTEHNVFSSLFSYCFGLYTTTIFYYYYDFFLYV